MSSLSIFWVCHVIPQSGAYLQFVSIAVWPTTVISTIPHSQLNGWLPERVLSRSVRVGTGLKSRFNRHIESQLTSERASDAVANLWNIHRHATTVLIPIKASHPHGFRFWCQGVGLGKDGMRREDLPSFNVHFQSFHDSWRCTYFEGVSGTLYSSPEQDQRAVQVVQKISSDTKSLTHIRRRKGCLNSGVVTRFLLVVRWVRRPREGKCFQ